VLVLSGLSGSGKTTALHALEDAGYFCVDNLPAALLPTFLRLVEENPSITRVALAMDVRERLFRTDLERDLRTLTAGDYRVAVLFLACDEDALVARFKTTRRPHPVVSQGAATTLPEAIAVEREWLDPIRALATHVVDSTALNVHDLKRRVLKLFGDAATTRLAVHLMSFGYRHGLPLDADYVFDVRFLDNPFFVEALRDKTGRDPEVAGFVMVQPAAERLRTLVLALLDEVVPRIETEGRASLTIAFGCTGGHHRSVTLCEAIGEDLRGRGLQPEIVHRDIER
jgi:UPF0042 nucleotide-binding protein